MPYEKGSLKKAMKKAVHNGIKVAVVVIDEQAKVSSEQSKNLLKKFLKVKQKTRHDFQCHVLSEAINLGCPVVLVEMNEFRDAKAPETVKTLQAAAGKNAFIIRKMFNNAFVETELEQKLKEWKTDVIVLMGTQTQTCVLKSVIGGHRFSYKTFEKGKDAKGAFRLGFKV